MTKSELVKNCERPLTATEAALLAFALTQSGTAREFHAQLPLLQVIAESTNSWPILEFSVGGRHAPPSVGLSNLADFQYETEKGLLGFFVYEREGLLAGMECWAIDGRADPDAWPSAQVLVPLRSETHNE